MPTPAGRARAALGIAAVLVAASACAPADSPRETDQGPRDSSSAPASAGPPIDYASGIPGLGQAVAIPGRGLTLAVLHALEWPEPRFLARADAEDRCDVQPGDRFVAVELHVEFSSPSASVSGLGLLVGPPRGSPLFATEDPYRWMWARWCAGPAWDDEDVPPPYLGGTSISGGAGTLVEGWLLFPVRADIAESGQVVLLYVPEAGAEGVEIQLGDPWSPG